MKKTIILIMLASFIVLNINVKALHAQEQENAVLKAIKIQTHEDYFEAVIEVDGEFSYQHFELYGPSRLVIELAPITVIETEPTYDVNAFGVSQIRVGQYQPTIVRVVFDLDEALPIYEISQIDNTINIKFRIEEVLQVVAEPEVEEEPEIIPAEEEAAHLQNLSYQKVDDTLKLKVKIDGAFQYQTLAYMKYTKFALDIQPIDRISADPVLEIQKYGFKTVSVTQVDEETARITFDFYGLIPSLKLDRTDDGLELTFIIKEALAQPTGEDLLAPRGVPSYRPLKNTMLGFSMAKYGVQAEVFDLVYGKSQSFFGFELNRQIAVIGNHNFSWAFEFRILSAEGASTITEEAAKFKMYPISFGLRYMMNLNFLIPYLGAGFDNYSYKEESSLASTADSAFGFHLQGGLYFRIPKAEFVHLKLFAKYTKVIAKTDVPGLETLKNDLGGMEFGVGLTFGFNILNNFVF